MARYDSVVSLIFSEVVAWNRLLIPVNVIIVEALTFDVPVRPLAQNRNWRRFNNLDFVRSHSHDTEVDKSINVHSNSLRVAAQALNFRKIHCNRDFASWNNKTDWQRVNKAKPLKFDSGATVNLIRVLDNRKTRRGVFVRNLSKTEIITSFRLLSTPRSTQLEGSKFLKYFKSLNQKNQKKPTFLKENIFYAKLLIWA